jgi:hypothetical protein
LNRRIACHEDAACMEMVIDREKGGGQGSRSCLRIPLAEPMIHQLLPGDDRHLHHFNGGRRHGRRIPSLVRDVISLIEY